MSLSIQVEVIAELAKLRFGAMIDWCRSNNLAFAVRCGGHSYEGFSQSASIVIDKRLMNSITVDTTTKTATAPPRDRAHRCCR